MNQMISAFKNIHCSWSGKRCDIEALVRLFAPLTTIVSYTEIIKELKKKLYILKGVKYL